MYMISFNSTETGESGGFSIDYYPSDQLINYRPKEERHQYIATAAITMTVRTQQIQQRSARMMLYSRG